MTLLSSITNIDVCIEWKDKSDWLWYKIVNWDSINLEMWVLLEGRDAPDGDNFSGPPFWVRLNDISVIQLGDVVPYWKRLVAKDDSD